MDMHAEGQNIFELVQGRGLTNCFQTEHVNSLTKIWPANNFQDLCLSDL